MCRYVLLVATSTFFLNSFHVVLTSKFRKLSGLKYPIAYASQEQADKDRKAYMFNCGWFSATRGHPRSLRYATNGRVMPSTSPTSPRQLHRKPAIIPWSCPHFWPQIPRSQRYPRRRLGCFQGRLRHGLYQRRGPRRPHHVRNPAHDLPQPAIPPNRTAH